MAASACWARVVSAWKNAGDWPRNSPIAVRNFAAPIAAPLVSVGRTIETAGKRRPNQLVVGSGMMRLVWKFSPPNGLTFPNLNEAPFGGEEFQTNLIMPEPTVFLRKGLPIVSIVRPTATEGIAMGVVEFLTAMGLFKGQSTEFFEALKQLAREADAAKPRG